MEYFINWIIMTLGIGFLLGIGSYIICEQEYTLKESCLWWWGFCGVVSAFAVIMAALDIAPTQFKI